MPFDHLAVGGGAFRLGAVDIAPRRHVRRLHELISGEAVEAVYELCVAAKVRGEVP